MVASGYVFSTLGQQRSFVLLHGFSKRTEQTPASDIATALRRMRLHEDKREDEEK